MSQRGSRGLTKSQLQEQYSDLAKELAEMKGKNYDSHI
jgi:hypothetical protein